MATAHNRSVYAPLPSVAPGFGFARSVASLVPTQNVTHIASGPVSGWKRHKQQEKKKKKKKKLIKKKKK
jgi:hypothetical protein